MRTIYSLQAGRALAAIAVVIHHAALAANSFGGGDFQLLELGYLGVDFFFVLSGFIIYDSTAGRGKTARTYAASRIKRIYAPYLPIGLAVAALYSLLPHASMGSRDWNWLPTLTLLPIGSPALSVAWTLQHEVLFYLLFGLFYFSGRLALGMALWAIAIIAARIFGTPDFIPLRIVNLEFFFGIAAAIAVRRGVSHIGLIPAALGCFTFWIAIGQDRNLSPIVGLGFALLIPVVVAVERASKIGVPRPMVFLGAASYSIYLAHGLAISGVARTLHGPLSILVCSVAAGIAAGTIYYLVVERTAMNPRQALVRLIENRRGLALPPANGFDHPRIVKKPRT